jgi:hypothetical protein
VREIGADCEIPIQADEAQGGTCDETSSNPKKSAEDPDEKPYNDQVDRADVRSGNWKKHGLFGAAPNEAEQ